MSILIDTYPKCSDFTGKGLVCYGMVESGTGGSPARYVWVLSSEDPQPVGVRGIWKDAGVWSASALWYD